MGLSIWAIDKRQSYFWLWSVRDARGLIKKVLWGAWSLHREMAIIIFWQECRLLLGLFKTMRGFLLGWVGGKPPIYSWQCFYKDGEVVAGCVLPTLVPSSGGETTTSLTLASFRVRTGSNPPNTYWWANPFAVWLFLKLKHCSETFTLTKLQTAEPKKFSYIWRNWLTDWPIRRKFEMPTKREPLQIFQLRRISNCQKRNMEDSNEEGLSTLNVSFCQSGA